MDMRNEKDAQVIYAFFIHILVAGVGFEPTDTSITVPRYTTQAPRHKSGLAVAFKSTIHGSASMPFPTGRGATLRIWDARNGLTKISIRNRID